MGIKKILTAIVTAAMMSAANAGVLELTQSNSLSYGIRISGSFSETIHATDYVNMCIQIPDRGPGGQREEYEFRLLRGVGTVTVTNPGSQPRTEPLEFTVGNWGVDLCYWPVSRSRFPPNTKVRFDIDEVVATVRGPVRYGTNTPQKGFIFRFGNTNATIDSIAGRAVLVGNGVSHELIVGVIGNAPVTPIPVNATIGQKATLTYPDIIRGTVTSGGVYETRILDMTGDTQSAVFINAIAQTTNGSALKFRLRKNDGSDCEVIKPGQSCSILIDGGAIPTGQQVTGNLRLDVSII
ncbi:hypothetical protein CLO54_21300 [Salmonella enterica]|nr:hypothetical protein [Salmonella enterica]